MDARMEITIDSASDRDNLVAELWYDNVMWAEISQEESELLLEIYPHPTGKLWTFKFEEALEFLQQAKRKLLGLDESTRPQTEQAQPSFAKQMEQMAADPAIQAELRAIEQEFTITELDGLEKL